MFHSYTYELHINNNVIIKEAARDIQQLLFQIIYSNLQILDIGENKLQTAGMTKIVKALQNISSLSELNIGWNRITEEAADDIAAVILNNSKLQILHMLGNKFQIAGMIKNANTLQSISLLSEWNIGWNKIADEAADSIAAGILY